MPLKNRQTSKLLSLFLLVLVFAAPCAAQTTPQTTPPWEIFVGYSLQRSDVREYFKTSPIIYASRGGYVNLNGWDASVTENINHWFGGTIDFSGHYKSPVVATTTNREQMYSIMYGPRFSYRAPGFTPFFHVLLGVAHADVKVTPTGPRASDSSFAAAAGGGLDLNIGSKAAIRLFQAEYFRTSLLGTRQDGLRASAGIVFHLGKNK